MEIGTDEAFYVSLKAAVDFAPGAVDVLKLYPSDYKRSGAFTLNDDRQFVTPGSTRCPALTTEPAKAPFRLRNIVHQGWALRTTVRLKGIGEQTDRRHFFISDTCDVLLMWERRYATHISPDSAETARLLVEDMTMASLAREIIDLAQA